MNNPPPPTPGLVRLDPSTLERLARRVAALITEELQQPTDTTSPPEPERLLSVSQVAAWWGVHRNWVYEHAEYLGAIRLGDSARAPLRFDAATVARRMQKPPHTTKHTARTSSPDKSVINGNPR